METVIEYAENRLKTCEDYDKAYWAAYLDGARAQKREDKEEFSRHPYGWATSRNTSK